MDYINLAENEFNLKNILHQNTNILIIGDDKIKINNIINNILIHKNKLNNHILIDCDHYDKIEKVIQLQTNKFLNNKKNNTKNNIIENITLVIRNITSDVAFFKNHHVSQIYYNGRQYMIDIITVLDISTHVSLKIDPVIRSNFDYVFVLRDENINNQKYMYNCYFGMFSNFDAFNKFYESNKNECIVVDYTCRNINKNVFYYNLI